jgi:hypothetical protein
VVLIMTIYKLYSVINYKMIIPIRAVTIKGRGVPLHAMEAHGGRGGIAPTHT